jgi:hypothetical protein
VLIEHTLLVLIEHTVRRIIHFTSADRTHTVLVLIEHTLHCTSADRTHCISADRTHTLLVLIEHTLHCTQVNYSDKLLGFDCGGQQWVNESVLQCGSLKERAKLARSAAAGGGRSTEAGQVSQRLSSFWQSTIYILNPIYSPYDD